MLKINKRPILIVEDNADDQVLLVRGLKEAAEHQPLILVNDAEEAVDYLFEQDCKMPSLIILDLSLPGMHGMELLRQIRETEATRPIPVVVLTGTDNGENLMNVYNMGANSYITKDLDGDVFQGKIRSTVDYWVDICQLPR